MTNEEMKAAVLAELQRICPHSNGERISLSSLDAHYILPIEDGWWLIRVGATKCTIGPDCDLHAMNWLCAYRLLGLEAKAKDAEIQRLRGALKETDERIKQSRGVIIGVWRHGDTTLRLETAVNEITKAQNIIADAVEGGKND